MIKAVFFDAGGTLFDVKGSVGEQYARFAKKYGVEVDIEFLNRRFGEVFKESRPLAFPGAHKKEIKSLERRWWYEIVRSVFEDIDFDDFDRLFDDLFVYFEGAEGWSLFPETAEVLERLQRKQLQLGVISNFDSRLSAVCESLGVRSFFKTMTISSQSGAAKPSPEIFKKALQEAGVSSGETVYIGDTLHHDIEGAQAVGMKALLLDRSGRYSKEAGAVRISDLRAVFDFL